MAKVRSRTELVRTFNQPARNLSMAVSDGFSRLAREALPNLPDDRVRPCAELAELPVSPRIPEARSRGERPAERMFYQLVSLLRRRKPHQAHSVRIIDFPLHIGRQG